MEQLNDTNIGKELLKHKLKRREDLEELKKLQSHGFNTELNFPNPYHFCIFCASASLKVTCRRVSQA